MKKSAKRKPFRRQGWFSKVGHRPRIQTFLTIRTVSVSIPQFWHYRSDFSNGSSSSYSQKHDQKDSPFWKIIWFGPTSHRLLGELSPGLFLRTSPRNVFSFIPSRVPLGYRQHQMQIAIYLSTTRKGSFLLNYLTWQHFAHINHVRLY